MCKHSMAVGRRMVAVQCGLGSSVMRACWQRAPPRCSLASLVVPLLRKRVLFITIVSVALPKTLYTCVEGISCLLADGSGHVASIVTWSRARFSVCTSPALNVLEVTVAMSPVRKSLSQHPTFHQRDRKKITHSFSMWQMHKSR